QHSDGGGGTCATNGDTRCQYGTYQVCMDGTWQDQQSCTLPQICNDTHGCVDCDPSVSTTCQGDSVYMCNSDGTLGPKVQDCAFESCVNGMCQDPCSAAAASRSYIGCEYWPVDLDNAVEVLAPYSPLTCSLYMGSQMMMKACVATDGSGTTAGACDYND